MLLETNTIVKLDSATDSEFLLEIVSIDNEYAVCLERGNLTVWWISMAKNQLPWAFGGGPAVLAYRRPESGSSNWTRYGIKLFADKAQTRELRK